MKLLTKEHTRRLLTNGRWNKNKYYHNLQYDDFRPVVKFFCPWGGAIWLLTELDPDEPDVGFGLCDLGLGSPEISKIRLSKLASLCGPGGLGIERDRWFRASKTLNAYAAEARAHGRVIA